ncbi:MAG: septum site-determining protein MinC [Anaerolineae bacterium]|nr:septum site-determining protein MinC [Anaerolineae bacterium]
MSVVSFKGTREGLVITLGEGAWREVLNDLMTQLSRPGAQSFFQGARVFLETGARALDVTQIEELIALLAQYRMTLVAVSEPSSQEAFNRVRTSLLAPPEVMLAEETVPSQSVARDETYALLVHRTVRSGQTYQYAGTIVVIGDVNPGAQLVAEGDVIVWGKLRGVVHAGAAGNDNAMVAALVLAPTQLRIGHLIARAPEQKRTLYFPEVARVRDGRIIVEPWTET